MKRRDFLKLSALLAIPSSSHKIVSVKAYALRKALYVNIKTNSGYSGWGEGDHESPAIGAHFIEKVLSKAMFKKDPFHSEHLWHNGFFEGFENGSTGLNPGALAAIDNAIWDLKGRIIGMPVHELLGSTGLEKVAVYGSFGRRKKGGFKTPSEMANTALGFVNQGYTTVKARMQLYDRDKNPERGFTYDCIKEIRNAVGDDINIMVDFNNGYTPSRAIELGLKLYEHFNITAIEEPVSSMNYPGLRQVVDSLPCDVNAGEHEYNKWQFRDLITIGNPDNLNLDVIKCGGISECQKIAGMGAAFDKPVMVHNTRPTLATAASLNLLSAISNITRVQEFSGMRPELDQHRFFENQLKFENGYLYIPQSPGLGLNVIEEEIIKEAQKG